MCYIVLFWTCHYSCARSRSNALFWHQWRASLSHIDRKRLNFILYYFLTRHNWFNDYDKYVYSEHSWFCYINVSIHIFKMHWKIVFFSIMPISNYSIDLFKNITYSGPALCVNINTMLLIFNNKEIYCVDRWNKGFAELLKEFYRLLASLGRMNFDLYLSFIL